MKSAASLKSKSSTWRDFKLQSAYQRPVIQVSTALILTIFAIIFFAAFAIRPTLATITELIKKIEDQTEVAEKLDKKTTALATAQSEYILIEDSIPLVQAAIPNTHSLDLLLKQIEGAAAQIQIPLEGVQVDSITFPDEAQISSVGTVVDLPITITISASYDKVHQFINLLSRMQRLIKVESVSFSKDSNLSEESLLRMSIHMRAFYLPIQEVE